MQLDFQFGARAKFRDRWSSLQLDSGFADRATRFYTRCGKAWHGPRSFHALAIHGKKVLRIGPWKNLVIISLSRYIVHPCPRINHLVTCWNGCPVCSSTPQSTRLQPYPRRLCQSRSRHTWHPHGSMSTLSFRVCFRVCLQRSTLFSFI